jgi:GTP-binding protein
MADIPGLIEGAAEGAGLGVRFLGHLERCAVLIHLVDATSEDVAADWRTVRGELVAYGAGLAQKPELVALSKIDALDIETRKAKLAALAAAIGQAPRLVSAVSGEGVTALLRAAFAVVAGERAPQPEPADDDGWTP